VKRVRAILLFCLVAVPVSLLLARIHPFGDAGLYATTSANAPIANGARLPGEIRTILIEKCADCHSTQTHAPLYGRFAPVSWLLERDVVEARKAMNLSQWDTYSADQQQTLAAKIVHETRQNEMPPAQYRLVHWNTRISVADLKVFDQWAHGVDALQTDAMLDGRDDPARGKALFEKRCTGCHALAGNHQGPQLRGVYGRTSGTVASYAYSAALKKAGVVWDEKSLDGWLSNPDSFVPGNEMDFLVSKPQERRDLIAYLKEVSGK
jgi:cytochrome c